MKILPFLLLGILLFSLVPNILAENEINESKPSIKTTVPGLENSILKAKSEEQKAHLESVLAKIQAHRLLILNKLNNLTFSEENNITIAEGGKPAKLLGFIKVNKSYKYTIDKAGNVIRKKGALDFLYKHEEVN